MVAHIGTWLAEAEQQLLERIRAGAARTYEGHDIDIDATKADLLEAMQSAWDI